VWISTLFNAWFLGPTRVSPQTASRSVQPFLHSTPVWTTCYISIVTLSNLYALYKKTLMCVRPFIKILWQLIIPILLCSRTAFSRSRNVARLQEALDGRTRTDGWTNGVCELCNAGCYVKVTAESTCSLSVVLK